VASNRKYTVESIGPRIDAFLSNVVKRAHLRLTFEVVPGEVPHPEIEDPEVVVRFSGPDVEVLLENKAELLLAFEQLTMEVLRMPSEDHSLLCFDADDYRMLRIEELRMAAITAADKVKRTHSPFRFNPMTSRERRIIHLALRNEPAVRSESIGMGPYRQVVIVPAGMPTPTAESLAASSFSRRGGRRR
jgi:spoIIIJ-associated protein